MPKFAKYFFAVLLCVAALPPAVANAAEPPSLDAYGELPNVEDAAISPEGTRIAAIATIRGQRVLLFLDSSMKVLRSASLGEVKSRGLQWAGEDAVLLVTSETVDLDHAFVQDQFEATRVMYIPLDPDVPINFVFSDSTSLVKAVFGMHGVREIDGEWYGYYGAIELVSDNTLHKYMPHTRPALFQVRLRDNRLRRVAVPAPENSWRDWMIDADGKVGATFEMSRDSGSWTLEGPKGNTIAKGMDKEGDAGLVSFGRDGSTAIYSIEGEDGESHWFEAPLDGSAEPHETLTDDGVDRVFVDRTNGRLIGFARGDGDDEPEFFDPAKQDAVRKVNKAFSKLDLTFGDWTPDLKSMLVRTSGNGDSGTWYMVDIENLAAGAFGVERPEIDRERVGPISVFAYTAADGLEMDGILTLPPDREAKDLPVVIYPHGGPTGQDDKAFDWWAQAFASRGYAVFQPNFRGSTNRDEAFRRAGNGEWGRKMQTDLSDGLTALAAAGIVDPSRACIMGASYGGYAALAGVTLQHGLYRCAVSVAGVSDLKLMYDTEYLESGRSRVVMRSLLEQLGPRSGLTDISPRHFAGQADAPILLVHGRDDTVVPFEQSAKMADALKDAGKEYELVDLGSEDHWLSLSATRKKMLAAAMAFVQKYNPAD